VIRDARVSDLDGVFGILNEHVMHGTATFDTEPYVVGRDDAWLIGRDLARHPVLVADDDGSVAGWAAHKVKAALKTAARAQPVLAGRSLISRRGSAQSSRADRRG